MILKSLLFAFFLLFNYLIYYITQVNIDQRTESSRTMHLHKLQVHYEVFLTTQSNIADVIFGSTINTSEIKKILIEAKQTNNLSLRESLRNKLQRLLSKKYIKMQEQGVLQLQFVLPNNYSFLRMHKPSKFGDDLSGARTDFTKVNTEHIIVRGFSQGRTAHAFRNIYPLFDKNKHYICAVEISYPSEFLQNSLNKISEIYSHFLVQKDIFNSKSWKRDDNILNYEQSIVNKDYLLTRTRLDERFRSKLNLNNRLEALKDEINKKMKEEKLFSLMSYLDNQVMVFSFIPIYQNFTGKVSAWIVSYEKDEFITTTLRESSIVRIIGFFLVLIIVLIVYRILVQKQKLNNLVNLYDKNVIFSTTDTHGFITHVSEAFCKISGFESIDLIGKPHNVVRHKEMSKEVFKDLWQTIKQGKPWRGEMKNIKKGGGSYWVEAEIEPLFEKSKLVGYSSIRHDITDRKEIEVIQKDIIFTMGAIGENRSRETGNHVKRVALYSRLFAKYYGLSNSEIETLYQASPMHDIGKIVIPDAILNKPGRLTDDEMTIMKTHAQKGYDMLSISTRPLLQSAAIVAHHHHEKWDGSGYPRGLIREEIHIFGRITAIADVFDALGSDRCYKKAWEDEKIFKLLKEESGKHFEPKLVEIFFTHLDEFLAIRDTLK